MNRHTRDAVGGLFAAMCSACAGVGATPSSSAPMQARGAPPTPRVFVLDGGHLAAVRDQIHDGDLSLRPAFDALIQEAHRAIQSPPGSVTEKSVVPPSGDKHDYMSRGPYWWPDPDKPDGLPYIRRDGETNPEIHQIGDIERLRAMTSQVMTLALAFHFSGDETFAADAVRRLRVWFLDPATRMNPHLRYGQGIPGHVTGRGIGLIDTRAMPDVIDAVGLLEGSPSLTAVDRSGLRDWFDRFLTWMLESEEGRDEADERNNHGTYYDLQVACLSLFVGRREVAVRVLSEVGKKRIVEVEPDGRQPLELARTRSWSYSVMNLAGLMSLARVAEHVGIDLWGYKTDKGAGLADALAFLASFGAPENPWPYKQISALDRTHLDNLVRWGATRLKDQRVLAQARALPPPEPADRHILLHPLPGPG